MVTDADSFGTRLDDVLVHMREMIADRGRVVVPVGSSSLYTVGLSGSGIPEVVLTAPPYLARMAEAIADWCLESTDNRVTVPSWTWRLPASTYPDSAAMTHTFATRWFEVSHDPEGPLGFVVALYGRDARAIHIDILSCPCDACADKVVVDAEGNTRPYTP